MTQYTQLVSLVRTTLGDQSGAVYEDADVLAALRNAYSHLLVMGYPGVFVTDFNGITPDLGVREQGLFAVAACCLLVGGKLADPSVSMSVKAEQTSYDGSGGAVALAKRLSELQSLLYRAILDGCSAVIAIEPTIGLALEDDSPILGRW